MKCPDCNAEALPTYAQHCRVCDARAGRLLLGRDLPARTLSGAEKSTRGAAIAQGGE